MREIILTRGFVALVDDDDFDWLSKLCRWKITKIKGAARPYACNSRKGRMHRLILAAPDGLEVDHINGNTLDNRRENLRICSISANRSNTTMLKNNTSGVKGVSWDKARGLWAAEIRWESRRERLGRYSSLLEAETVVNAARARLHGAFANPGRPLPPLPRQSAVSEKGHKLTVCTATTAVWALQYVSATAAAFVFGTSRTHMRLLARGIVWPELPRNSP